MLEALRVAVVRDARVLHRGIDDDLNGYLELAGGAADRDVRACQGDQVLLRARCVDKSHAEQPLRIDEDLVGGHAASS